MLPSFGLVSALIMLIFLAMVAALAILALRALGQGPRPSGSSGLEILKERYARGEIPREEYRRMREELRE